MNRRSLTALAITAFALAAPQAAGADNLYAEAGAGATTCAIDDPCSLDQAIMIADIVSNRDTIHASGHFMLGDDVDLTQSPIDLVGAGGDTVLDGDAAAVFINSASSVSSLSITTQRGTAVITQGGSVADLHIETGGNGIAELAQSNTQTSIDHVDVTSAGTPLGLEAGNTTVTDSTFSSPRPSYAEFRAYATVTRSTFSGDKAFAASDGAQVTVADSVFRATGATAVTSTSGAILTLDSATIDGAGSGTWGVHAGGGGTVNLTDSIVHGFSTDLVGDVDSPDWSGVDVKHSDFQTSVDVVEGAGNTTADPRWVDASAGDYRLAADSPLIDRGRAGAADAGETDRAGDPRVVDGDGDGAATRDIGAFEAPVPAPRAPDPVSGDSMTEQPHGDSGAPAPGPASAPEPRPQAQAPAPLKLALASGKLRLNRRGQGKVSVTCSAAPCSVKLTITAGKRRLATVSGRAGKLKVRLSRAYLKKHRIRRVKISATATAGGRTAIASRTFRVL